MKQFLMGNEILAQAAFDAGSLIMFGYPITPTTEVLSTWIKLAKMEGRKYLQTEDETSAGFGVCGSVLAGVPAFTATAGPGNVLMQDAMSMAEAMRLPTVVFVGQRGGPSTGTVIYSQQELFLTAFGGNGEGLRLVYAPSSLQELYDLTIKSFINAWKYRFPTFILYDGYLGKMRGPVNLPGNEKTTIPTKPILTKNMRNCFDLEDEVYEQNMENYSDWKQMAKQICEFEISGRESETLIIAHGIVAAAAKEAGVFLFRPITVWPFPDDALKKITKNVKKIIVVESSLEQLSKLVRYKLFGWQGEIESIGKPALGFTPEEIKKVVENE